MPATVKIKVTIDRLDAVLKAVHTLVGEQVLVGIPAEKAQRPGDPINNATLGYIHEFGSPRVNIPPRPHLVPGIEDARDQIVKRLENAGRAALKLDTLSGSALSTGQDNVRNQLIAVGILASQSVKRRIQRGLLPDLAASTKRARIRNGFTAGGIKPLIDTGEYLNSITYVLRALAD